jgi:hypothetical protein
MTPYYFSEIIPDPDDGSEEEPQDPTIRQVRVLRERWEWDVAFEGTLDHAKRHSYPLAILTGETDILPLNEDIRRILEEIGNRSFIRALLISGGNNHEWLETLEGLPNVEIQKKSFPAWLRDMEGSHYIFAGNTSFMTDDLPYLKGVPESKRREAKMSLHHPENVAELRCQFQKVWAPTS